MRVFIHIRKESILLRRNQEKEYRSQEVNEFIDICRPSFFGRHLTSNHGKVKGTCPNRALLELSCLLALFARRMSPKLMADRDADAACPVPILHHYAARI